MAARADEPSLEGLLDGLPDPERSPVACCAALYAHPGVRWVLGGELHPGGAGATRRALELAALEPGERLLDIGCGGGEAVLLAARELGAEAIGLEASAAQVEAARAAADELDERVEFVLGDGLALPFEAASFDVVLMECALSTIPDKAAAVGEIARVLRLGGRFAISDVVADPQRLPAGLRGPLASLACVGAALGREGYEALLAEAGLGVSAFESLDEEAARLAERIEDRLRGARVLGFAEVGPAIELVGLAREAIAAGSLGYAIFAGSR